MSSFMRYDKLEKIGAIPRALVRAALPEEELTL